jgi:hypothetical protein
MANDDVAQCEALERRGPASIPRSLVHAPIASTNRLIPGRQVGERTSRLETAYAKIGRQRLKLGTKVGLWMVSLAISRDSPRSPYHREIVLAGPSVTVRLSRSG